MRVGTSEIIRPLIKNNKYKSQSQWQAGQIDGDGCFLISKKGYPSCEITMELSDELALNKVKNLVGGNIKPRSGYKSIRWRQHNKKGIEKLINQVNGEIRNSIRKEQFNKICLIQNIKPIKPISININNGWFAGFFDADGTISMSIKNGYPQQTISVTNKQKENIESFKNIFGGNIYFDKHQKGCYKWTIQSYENIFIFLNYIKINPIYSHKRSRFFLIPKFFVLKKLKAYNNSNPIIHKTWLNFIKDW